MSDLNTEDQAEVLDFVENSLTTIETLRNENAELKKANETLTSDKATLEADNVRLEKVASDTPEPEQFKFEDTLIDKTLDKLASMSYISDQDKSQIKNIVSDNPETVFGLITKIAETTILGPSGLSIDKISDSHAKDSDPFGWLDAVKPTT
jgi:hypothetical protein